MFKINPDQELQVQDCKSARLQERKRRRGNQLSK